MLFLFTEVTLVKFCMFFVTVIIRYIEVKDIKVRFSHIRIILAVTANYIAVISPVSFTWRVTFPNEYSQTNPSHWLFRCTTFTLWTRCKILWQVKKMTMEDTLNTESLVKSNSLLFVHFELIRLPIYYFWFLGEYGFLICQFLRYVRVNVYGGRNRNIKYHNTNHRNKIEK